HPAIAHGQRATGCEVDGSPSLGGVMVTAPGVTALALALDGVPVRAAVPATAAATTVIAAHGALRFTARRATVPYALARPIEVAGGIARLTTAAEIEDVRTSGASGTDVVMNARTEPGAVLHGVVVRCASLTLGLPTAGGAVPATTGDGSYWTARQARVLLRERPDASARVEVRFIHRADSWVTPTPFQRVARSGAWVQVTSSTSGAALTGWVLANELRPATLGFGASGTSNSTDFTCLPLPPTPPGAYRGPATIEPGATVLTSEGGAPWATVTTGATGFVVVAVPGQAWARVITAPGIAEMYACDRELHHAWVARAAVTLP
ncbi:MAG: hypothetical protein WCJ30_19935, partial [Deltaproteobacteria bacterium]